MILRSDEKMWFGCYVVMLVEYNVIKKNEIKLGHSPSICASSPRAHRECMP